MRRPTKTSLLDNVRRALVANGWQVAILSSLGSHPAKFEIQRGDERHRFLVYIWSLTHGGATRSRDEYRIQITSGVRSFAAEPEYSTVILGWSDEFGVFAGFDFQRRSGSLGSSPSIQIARQTLEGALARGAATQDKGRGELAVAVRPDALGNYLRRAAEVHSGDLSGVLADPISEERFEDFFEARSKATNRVVLFGSSAERGQRRRIAAALDAVDEELDKDRSVPGRGHNNPPELLPDETTGRFDEIKLSTSEIRAELEKPNPNPTKVAAIGLRLARIKDFVKGVISTAKEDLQETLGKDIAAGIRVAIWVGAPALLGKLVELLGELVKWFQMLF